jgi:LuxR family maltose regulon positive regulatory protein
MKHAREALALEHGPWRAISANCLGTASYWLDDTAGARTHLAETVELGRELVPLVALFALGLLALIDAESGDWTSASRRLHEARRTIEAGALSEYWMTAAVELVAGLAAEHENEILTAETSMARSLVLYRRGQAPVETAGALLHLARVHRRQGLDVVARDETDEAAALVAACPAPGERIMRLIARARRDSRPRARAGIDRADALSERELGVLRLLATDLTQREIGSHLYLSLNTVKSHTRSIFRKLGVSGREQAVARARELELL